MSFVSSTDHIATLIRKGSTLSASFRWIVLLVVCICIYSMIYCYDNPFALQNQLMDEYSLSPVQYNFLYSIYGYVNVISPLIAGILIDYIGINTSSLLFYLLIVIGQSVWICGCYYYSYSIMVLGRGLFGAGAQPFHTSRKYYSFEYFEGQEYSFASGMTLFASRMASATQSYVTTFIYDSTNSIVLSLSVGAVLTLLSFICLISFIIYKTYAVSRDGLKTFTLPHILYRRYLRRKNRKNKAESGSLMESSSSVEKKNFNLDGLCNGAFDRRFIMISLLIMTFYSSYLSFTNVGSSFLQSKYSYSYENANFLITIGLFVAAFTIPLLGLLIDKYGKRCPLLALSAALLIIAYCVLGFGDINTHFVIQIFGLIAFGLGMAVGSSILWPSVALICNKQYLATALGFIGCLDNASQATSFLIVGVLTKDYGDDHDHRDQYEYVIYWLLFLSSVMFVCSLLLWYFDKTQFRDTLNRMEAKFDITLSTIERKLSFSSKQREGKNENTEANQYIHFNLDKVRNEQENLI